MGILNGMYIHVTEEEINREAEVPEHPVEKGLAVTDYVKLSPMKINLTGNIVGVDASDTLSKIYDLYNTGAFVNYNGRIIMRNVVISSFSTVHDNQVAGGCSFTMTLNQVKVANSPYSVPKAPVSTAPTKSLGTQQIQTASQKQMHYHTVKSGECAYTIAGQYKSKGVTLDYIMKNNNNSNCLGKVGDWRTLKVGEKLKLGEW